MLFLKELNRYLDEFLPHSSAKITVKTHYFRKTDQTVADFVQEIRETAKLLENAAPNYAEIYAKKLLDQFNALQNAVAQILKEKPVFKASVQLSPKIHRLPPAKRLVEYRKALRALNEKISWLTEQQLQTQLTAEKLNLENQLAETAYRKQKCLAAIEALEEELKFR